MKSGPVLIIYLLINILYNYMYKLHTKIIKHYYYKM
jgi:hypothetical protein